MLAATDDHTRKRQTCCKADLLSTIACQQVMSDIRLHRKYNLQSRRRRSSVLLQSLYGISSSVRGLHSVTGGTGDGVNQACNHLLVSACTMSVVTVVNSVHFPSEGTCTVELWIPSSITATRAFQMLASTSLFPSPPPVEQAWTFLLLLHAQKVAAASSARLSSCAALHFERDDEKKKRSTQVKKQSASKKKSSEVLWTKASPTTTCISRSLTSEKWSPREERRVIYYFYWGDDVTAQWDKCCGLCSRSNAPPRHWDTWQTHLRRGRKKKMSECFNTGKIVTTAYNKNDKAYIPTLVS